MNRKTAKTKVLDSFFELALINRENFLPLNWVLYLICGGSINDASAAARVGTSSTSLILPQAAGFGRSAVPPSSSANALLVCLGAAPAGPFSSHIGLSAMQGGFQRGTDVPLCVVAGVGSIGEGPHRKGPAPVRVFGYFLHEQKVTQGTGLKAPKAIK